MEINNLTLSWVLFATAFVFFSVGVWSEKRKVKYRKSQKNKRLSDYEKWQRNIKNNVTDGGSSIVEICKHPNRITRVIDTTANCETTVEVCIDCWKEVTQPKTDCR